jgi:hypothetical protein
MAARSGRPGPVLAALTAAAGLLILGCAGPSGPAATPARPQRATAPATSPAPPVTSSAPPASGSAPPGSPAPRPRAALTVIPVPGPPGRLHQTRARPSARSRAFRAEMTDLWAAIVAGRPGLARPGFFPVTAYQQVKAIFDPAADWRTRLFGDFRLDVAAAHRYLGRGARRARLVRVIVPAAQAAWIVPGVCENAVGYWHVGGARLVYRQHGQERSLGIASLISWRGRWYVVHFGAVLRAGPGGVVDSPAAGPGVPGPAGGC